MITCNLKQIHRERHTLPITIKNHTHNADELTYFISGNGTTNICGQENAYKAGNFAFYKKGTPHDEVDPNPCDIIWLHFDYDIEGVELREGVFFDADGRLLSALQRLRNHSLEQERFSGHLTEVSLAEAIVLAAEKQNDTEPSGDKINWKHIIELIDNNINEQIDFKALAENHHYSYHHFRHLFVRHFGASPYAYLTEQRILHAKRLLKNSDSSITEIALNSGFNSSSQFINIFKRNTGLTPREYRLLKKKR